MNVYELSCFDCGHRWRIQTDVCELGTCPACFKKSGEVVAITPVAPCTKETPPASRSVENQSGKEGD